MSGDTLTKEIQKSLLPVCDKPYHNIKENVPDWEELIFLRYCIVVAYWLHNMYLPETRDD